MAELHFITPDKRRSQLRIALQRKACLRVLETHSPLSALIAERACLRIADSDAELAYDAFWSSSLTDSTERGKPDIEVLDIPNRLANINDIFEVTSMPLIMDGDTGGKPDHFAFNIRSLERVGVSAVIIEDKTGLKKNSLFGIDVHQEQEDVSAFCEKIRLGKAAQMTDDFMIIARVESLILNAGMEDALNRSDAYVGAGADAIMIHSRSQSPNEIMEFARLFRSRHAGIPLICVPTSYAATYFYSLEAAGFNMVIYANHMLRSSYLAMDRVANDILRFGRTQEVETHCLSIKDILDLIPGTR